MELSKIITKKNIIFSISPKEKESFLTELSTFLCESNGLKNSDEITKAILKRESQDTTGVGDEVAIPHARIPNIKKTYAACCVVKDGQEFNSLDGKPVKLIFIMISPEDAPDTHIKLLSKLANVLNNKPLFNKIISSAKTDDIFNLLKESDA